MYLFMLVNRYACLTFSICHCWICQNRNSNKVKDWKQIKNQYINIHNYYVQQYLQITLYTQHEMRVF